MRNYYCKHLQFYLYFSSDKVNSVIKKENEFSLTIDSIQYEATYKVKNKAKEKGADILKQ